MAKARHILSGALLLAILSISSIRFWAALPSQFGYDLYQFWGVAKAQRESGYRLGSPYLHPDAYKRELQKIALQSGDETLLQATDSRDSVDLTATPLLYYLYGYLPDSYRTVVKDFRALQLIAFILGAFLTIRACARAVPWPPCLLLSVALAAAFDPVLLDVAVGNLSSIQSLNLALIATLLARHPAGASPISAIAATALAFWLVLLTMLKPDVAGATLLLGLTLLASTTRRGTIAVILSGLVSIIILLTIPTALFGSTSLWSDWLQGPFQMLGGQSILEASGNFSTIAFFRKTFGWPLGVAVPTSFLLLALPLILTTRFSTHEALPRPLADRVLELLRQPFLCAAAGIIAMLAISPVVWSHYLVLMASAALFCCFSDDTSPTVKTLGWLSLLLMADLPRRLFQFAGAMPLEMAAVFHCFSWLPAWVGICSHLARPDPLPKTG